MEMERISMYKPEPKIVEPGETKLEEPEQQMVNHSQSQIQIQIPASPGSPGRPSGNGDDRYDGNSRLELANRVFLFADGYEHGVVLYVQGFGNDEFVVTGMDIAARSEQQETDFDVWQREMVLGGDGIATMTKIVDPTVIVGAIAQFVNPDVDKREAGDSAVFVDLKFPSYKVWDKLSSYVASTSQIHPKMGELLLLSCNDYSDVLQKLIVMSKDKASSNLDSKESAYQQYINGINNVNGNMPYPSNFDSAVPIDFSDDVNHFDSGNGGIKI